MKKLLHLSIYLIFITVSFLSNGQETRLGYDDIIPVFFSEFHYDDNSEPQDMEFLEIVTIAGYSLDGWSIEVITEDSLAEPYIWQSIPLSGFGTLDITHTTTIVTHYINVPLVDLTIGNDTFTFGGIPDSPPAILLRDPNGEIKEFISAESAIVFEGIESHVITSSSGSLVSENSATSPDTSIQTNGFNDWTTNATTSPNFVDMSDLEVGYPGFLVNVNQAYEVTWTGVDDFWNTEHWAVFDGTFENPVYDGPGFYQQSTLNIPSGKVTLNSDTRNEICHNNERPTNGCTFKTHVKQINNDGDFFIDTPGNLEVNESIDNTGILRIDGTIFGSLDIINSGTFTMNSEQISATNLNNSETINIGDSYGSSFTGDMENSGTLNFTINGGTPRQPNTGYQQLSIDGDLNLEGTLNVTIDPFYLPADGNIHSIITYTGSLTGTFTTVNLPPFYRIDYSIPGQINVIRDSSVLTTNTFNLNSIRIFPNPSSTGVINVTGIQNNADFEVFDLNGRKILTFQNISNNAILNISGLENGIYFSKIKTEIGIAVKRFIKK